MCNVQDITWIGSKGDLYDRHDGRLGSLNKGNSLLAQRQQFIRTTSAM
jgi:hypothetical protein